MKETQWNMRPNKAKAMMLAFYDTGDQKEMNAFLRSCLEEKVIRIMQE